MDNDSGLSDVDGGSGRAACEAGSSEVVIGGGLRSGTAAVLVILGSAIAVGLLFSVFNPRPETMVPFAPVLLAAAGVVLGLWAIFELLHRERLVSASDHLVYEMSLAGFCWRRCALPRDVGADLRVFLSGSRRGVIFTAGGKRWHIGRGARPDEIRKLHAWLAAHREAAEREAGTAGADALY